MDKNCKKMRKISEKKTMNKKYKNVKRFKHFKKLKINYSFLEKYFFLILKI